tara:strand:+ start:4052 stop:4906 length:855 start_codon:yes stop_codon:yes gene_type:complete
VNKPSLSIIIAHYCISQSSDHYNSFLKNLEIIKSQSKNYDIEIIICDDGSEYSKEIMGKNSESIKISNDPRKIFILKKTRLESWLNKIRIENYLIKKWIYMPKTKLCMSKARLWNYSTKISGSDYLLFLDDDNYFVSKNTIRNTIELFNSYDIIFGQIKDNNNKLRSYNSNRVQGTTIGIKKFIINDINGFGEWTEKTSCGIDSDLWIKLFNYYNKNKETNICYTNLISTYDSCSKRWRRYTKIFKELQLRREFSNRHGISFYKNPKYNKSRQKKLWITNLIDA